MNAFFVHVVRLPVPAIGGTLTNIWVPLYWCKLTGGWSIPEIRALKKDLINCEIHFLSTDVIQSWIVPKLAQRYFFNEIILTDILQNFFKWKKKDPSNHMTGQNIQTWFDRKILMNVKSWPTLTHWGESYYRV